MKGVAHQMLAPFASLYRHWTRDSARIVMYHRFAKTSSPRRTLASTFDEQVQFLQRHYDPCKMGDLVTRMGSGKARRGLTAITVDDGYRDFLELAYPVLLRYRVPATLYIVTDFVDGRWLWFDALHYLLTEAPSGDYRLIVAGETHSIRLSTAASRDLAWNKLGDVFLALPTPVREEALDIVQLALGMTLPARATENYAPLSWEDLRGLDPTLIEIGSHTCSHPILSRCTPVQIESEVVTSMRRIEEELGRSVRSFAYPNGQPADYNSVVTAAVESAGYSNAVVAHGSRAAANSSRYTLERLTAPAPHMEFHNAIDWAW